MQLTDTECDDGLGPVTEDVSSHDWDDAQRAYWSAVAPDYDDFYRSGWSRLEDRWVRDQLSFIGSQHTPTVLDLGCGTGLGLQMTKFWNSGASYIGVDISPAMATIMTQAYDVRCVVAPMDDLSWLADESVDTVLALFSSASFSSSPRQLMLEVKRVLKPMGHAYISVLGRRRNSAAVNRYLTRGHANESEGTLAHRYTARMLGSLAADAGLDAIRVRGMNALSGIHESPRLWAVGRGIAMAKPNWSHLLDMHARRPAAPEASGTAV